MLSMCSPAIKLSYAMSAYYEANPVDTSCDFAGNATLNPNRKSYTPRICITLMAAQNPTPLTMHRQPLTRVLLKK